MPLHFKGLSIVCMVGFVQRWMWLCPDHIRLIPLWHLFTRMTLSPCKAFTELILTASYVYGMHTSEKCVTFYWSENRWNDVVGLYSCIVIIMLNTSEVTQHVVLPLLVSVDITLCLSTQWRSFDCLEVKREYYQNSSVLDCVTVTQNVHSPQHT